MAEVTYHLANGEKLSVDVPAGETVMKGAVTYGIPGIVAECGGVLTCATCHVHVLNEWYDRFPAPDISEQEMLEIVDNLQPCSRLSCQLKITDALSGVQVRVPQD